VPWTVDDAPTMASLIDRGVDGLITDYPDIGREVMAAKGLPLRSSTPRRSTPKDIVARAPTGPRTHCRRSSTRSTDT
jgi:hypothetical protein